MNGRFERGTSRDRWTRVERNSASSLLRIEFFLTKCGSFADRGAQVFFNLSPPDGTATWRLRSHLNQNSDARHPK